MLASASIEITQFYGWWQVVTCCFAFLGLLSIWYHIGKKQQDNGQVWLALSILCWSFSGGVDLLFLRNGLPNEAAKLQLEGWRSIFSLLNSLFILLALPWFRYLPDFLKATIQSKSWPIIVLLPFSLSLIFTISQMIQGESDADVRELDVYYGILTLMILGMVLWESFSRRRLIGLAYLSVLCILITLAAQIFKIYENEVVINLFLFSAIFKSLLIMIFFALALSWVKDLSEQLNIQLTNLSLKLSTSKTSGGRWTYKAELKGILPKPSIIQLSQTHFDLLQLFANRRKQESDGWLEIMPKAEVRSKKTYDIRDYNEVKRLSHKMLDQIFGAGQWSKTQHEIPFRAALFERSENRDRKIRLKLPAEQITLTFA